MNLISQQLRINTVFDYDGSFVFLEITMHKNNLNTYF